MCVDEPAESEGVSESEDGFIASDDEVDDAGSDEESRRRRKARRSKARAEAHARPRSVSRSETRSDSDSAKMSDESESDSESTDSSADEGPIVNALEQASDASDLEEDERPVKRVRPSKTRRIVEDAAVATQKPTATKPTKAGGSTKAGGPTKAVGPTKAGGAKPRPLQPTAQVFESLDALVRGANVENTFGRAATMRSVVNDARTAAMDALAARSDGPGAVDTAAVSSLVFLVKTLVKTIEDSDRVKSTVEENASTNLGLMSSQMLLDLFPLIETLQLTLNTASIQVNAVAGAGSTHAAQLARAVSMMTTWPAAK